MCMCNVYVLYARCSLFIHRICRNEYYCTHKKSICQATQPNEYMYWYAHFSKRYVHRLASMKNYLFFKENLYIERMKEKGRTNKMPILYRIVFTGVYQDINPNYGEKVLLYVRHGVPASQHILGFHTLTPFVNIRPEYPICYHCNCVNQCSQNRNDSRFEHQKSR